MQYITSCGLNLKLYFQCMNFLTTARLFAFIFLQTGISNFCFAQILNIDKRNTADYVNKAKWNYQFSIGL